MRGARTEPRRRIDWAAALALVLLAPIATPSATAGTAPDDAMALTGVSTPESEAIDNEIQKMVEERAKLVAAAQERSRKGQPTTDLMQQAASLVREAYKKAEVAADARAEAAVVQRCIKPSEDAGSAGSSSASSSFVCSAVLAAKGNSGTNDPWTVCTCARRYLIGLKKELDELRAGRSRFVGKRVASSTLVSTYDLTQADVDGRYRMDQSIEIVPAIGDRDDGSITGFSRRVQRQIARNRVEGLFSARPPRPVTLQDVLGVDGLDPTKHSAYIRVQQALRLTWEVRRNGTLLQVGLMQQAVNERQDREWTASYLAQKAIWAAHRIPSEGDPESIALARRYDAMLYGYLQGTVPDIRSIAAKIREARYRLRSDAEVWKNFAASDGGGGGPEEDFARYIQNQFMIEWSLMVGMPPWRASWVSVTKTPEYAFLMPGHDASNDYQELIRDLQIEFPEARFDINTPSLNLVYPINTAEKEIMEAVVSGAGSTQTP